MTCNLGKLDLLVEKIVDCRSILGSVCNALPGFFVLEIVLEDM